MIFETKQSLYVHHENTNEALHYSFYLIGYSFGGGLPNTINSQPQITIVCG